MDAAIEAARRASAHAMLAPTRPHGQRGGRAGRSVPAAGARRVAGVNETANVWDPSTPGFTIGFINIHVWD